MQIGQFCERFDGRLFRAALFEHVEHACVIRCEHYGPGWPGNGLALVHDVVM
jgi:hypothetical protein